MLPNILKGFGVIGILILVIDGIIFFRQHAQSFVNSKKFYLIILTVGVILAVLLPLGVVIQDASRGNDTLSSTHVDGITVGNDSIEYQQSQINSITNQYVDTSGNNNSYHILISENTIYFNGQEIGGVGKFEEYLRRLDRRSDVFLEDDFAVSLTYHEVEELLNDLGFTIIGRDENAEE